MTKNIVDSYLDMQVDPIQKKHGLLFLYKVLEKWIVFFKRCTLQHNFITLNGYICNELKPMHNADIEDSVKLV